MPHDGAGFAEGTLRGKSRSIPTIPDSRGWVWKKDCV
jgi:hypothetical protein